MDWHNNRRNVTIYRRGGREDPSFENKRVLKKKRTIIFEFTYPQICFFIVVVTISFMWIFYLGLTLGRQFPEDEHKLSLAQKLAVAMGYNYAKKETSSEKSNQDKPASPGEMQLNLTYYQELSKPLITSANTSTSRPSKTGQETPKKQQRQENVQTQQQSVLPPAPTHREDIVVKPETSSTVTVESTGEKYTVLVASFRSPENANRLEQTLRSKGYIVSRQETVIRNETWYRITVGNFDSRDSAVRFMAMFNEKEGLKGVVVRK